jgi:hypothetical protein
MAWLNPEQRAHFSEHGFLHLRGALSSDVAQRLAAWTDELAAWPETPGKWMKYFERSARDGSRQLCRVEDFLPYHAALSGFLLDEARLGLLSELMGERAVLFKEKINFKLPGGKGFKPHQDAPAFTTFKQTYHITLLAPVDAATVENGCLDVVRGHPRDGVLPQEPDGTLRKDVVDSLRWEPLPMEPGDLLYFDSYLPHGSAHNRSQSPRRALYVTYNRASEGSRRDEYFASKRAAFPPECERIPGVDYASRAGIYNLGNPID